MLTGSLSPSGVDLLFYDDLNDQLVDAARKKGTFTKVCWGAIRTWPTAR